MDFLAKSKIEQQKWRKSRKTGIFHQFSMDIANFQPTFTKSEGTSADNQGKS